MRYPIQKLHRLSSIAFRSFLAFTFCTIVLGLGLIGLGFVGDFSDQLWLAFSAAFLLMIVSVQVVSTTNNMMSIEKKGRRRP